MKKSFAIVLLAASAIAFVFGVVWLFELRLSTGDVYPAYSSLRSDPLGTMALYESLERLPALTVQRDFRPTNELPTEPGTVYLHLGGIRQEWDAMPEDLFIEINGFLARGGRLVVAFRPQNNKSEPPVDATAKPADQKIDQKKPEPKKSDDTTPAPAKPKKKSTATDADEDSFVSLKDKWGIDFDFVELSDAGGSLAPVDARNVSGLHLPVTLEWHSGMVFTNLDKSWQTIYSRGKNAVVVTRQFGRGSVVMATDSYFLSNEAMSKDRHADLLAWLIGPNTQIQFDEAHFGIVEETGIAGLIRQYNLVWFVGGLFLLAGMFAWKNFFSLVPLPPAENASIYVAGKDSAAGFVNLLRRNVPTANLLDLCFAEWKKSAAGARPGAKIAEIQAVLDAEKALPARQRNPVGTYHNIALILKKPVFSGAVAAPQSTKQS